MMGRREDRQVQFLYAFDLDKVVPADHLVRQIDDVLDLSWVHKELAPYYSHTGRPSIDPVLMIRMLLVGYVFALRSERRLCAEVQVNLAYRWFCRLSVEDHILDHSVFSRARHERFRESDALRRVFEGVVAMCIAAGLVGGEAFSVDASLIRADVDKRRRVPGDQPINWPKVEEEASRAVREYITALDAARSDDDSGDGGTGRPNRGSDRGKPPKEVSLTDPQATWVARPGADPFFAYDANYLIDNKAGIIIDAEGTRANRVVEIAVTQTMMERVTRRFGLRPQRLAGDTVYGAVRLLKWLVDRSITPHIPVWDKSARHDGTFSSDHRGGRSFRRKSRILCAIRIRSRRPELSSGLPVPERNSPIVNSLLSSFRRVPLEVTALSCAPQVDLWKPAVSILSLQSCTVSAFALLSRPPDAARAKSGKPKSSKPCRGGRHECATSFAIAGDIHAGSCPRRGAAACSPSG